MGSETISRTIEGGLFITLEGIDGSGKTTVAQALSGWLRMEGFTVNALAEPGGTEYGRQARELFLKTHHTLVPEAEVGLLITAKAQLLQTQIKPTLAAGGIVICDRYTDTLYAYQHGAKGYSERLIDDMLIAADCLLSPDLTIYFDVTAETSMRRNLERTGVGGDNNSFDTEGLEFRNKLIQTFKSRMDEAVDRAAIVNAEQNRIRVLRDAQLAVMGKLHEKKAFA